jgi:SOS-response transcriptional repressor LexA
VRRLGLLLGAALLLVSVAVTVALRGRFTRVAVSGHSMEPLLHDGDWLLVDRRLDAIAPADVVVAYDPRVSDRLIVKRVAQVRTDSDLVLSSDHPAHADDFIGPVGLANVVGRAPLIYWPPSRARLVRRKEAGAISHT